MPPVDQYTPTVGHVQGTAGHMPVPQAVVRAAGGKLVSLPGLVQRRFERGHVLLARQLRARARRHVRQDCPHGTRVAQGASVHDRQPTECLAADVAQDDPGVTLHAPRAEKRVLGKAMSRSRGVARIPLLEHFAARCVGHVEFAEIPLLSPGPGSEDAAAHLRDDLTNECVVDLEGLAQLADERAKILGTDAALRETLHDSPRRTGRNRRAVERGIGHQWTWMPSCRNDFSTLLRPRNPAIVQPPTSCTNSFISLSLHQLRLP